VNDKGISKTYNIRIDIDDVDIDMIPHRFKSDNCVYPKANLDKKEYVGNRHVNIIYEL